MKIKLSADDIANEIRMHAVAHKGHFVLVEGGADERFYKQIFKFTDQEMIIAFGYENVLGAIAILDADNFDRVLGIIDRDYHGIVSPIPLSPNVLLTDDRDLEVMLFESVALMRLLEELASKPKIAKEADGLSGIRTKIYAAATPLGKLRLLAASGGVQISFLEVKYGKFIEKKGLTCNEQQMLAHLRGLQKCNAGLAAEAMDNANTQFAQYNPPLVARQYCRGHDLVSMAAIGLRALWGNNTGKEVSPDKLEIMLRMSADKDSFRATQLGQGIISWFQQKQVAV